MGEKRRRVRVIATACLALGTVTMILPSQSAVAATPVLALANVPHNIAAPANVNVGEFSPVGGARVYYDAPVATVDGVVDPSVTVNCYPPSGNVYRIGSVTTVSCSATDSATTPTGVSANFTITVTPGPVSQLQLLAHANSDGSVTYQANAEDVFNDVIADVTPYTVFAGSGGAVCTGSTCSAPGGPGTYPVTATYGSIVATTNVVISKAILPVTVYGEVVNHQHVLFYATTRYPNGQLAVVPGANCATVPQDPDGLLISTALPYGTYTNANCSADPLQSPLYTTGTGAAPGTIVSAPFGVLTATVPDTHVKGTYSAHLAAYGGSNYSWSVIDGALPPGIKLAASGQLSGAATVAGSYSFTVKVQIKPGVTTTWSYGITVSATAVNPLSITTAWLAPGTLGKSYSVTLQGAGGAGTKHWKLISGYLPTGLRISGATISGTPKSEQGGAFTIRLTDSANPAATVTREFVINVFQIAIVPGPGSVLKPAKVGTRYSFTFKTAGSIAPLIWDSFGQLPPGLTLSRSGVLSGIPTTAGTYVFGVELFDSGGNNTAETVELVIN